MKKRITAIILLLSLGIMFASCGQEGSNGNDTKNSSESESGAVSTDEELLDEDGNPIDKNGFIKDSLGELNFDGETLNILYRDDVVDAFYVTDQYGDIVSDSVYEAVKSVEERIGVKLNVIKMAGSANADRPNYVAAITNSVMANDNEYDLAGVLTYNIPELIRGGALADLMEVPHIDFDKPWWTSALTDMATINGKLYMASGDISLELTERIYCMLFDKGLAESLGCGDIYSLVRDGKWTFDKMSEFAAGAYKDLDGDSKVGKTDGFGLVINDWNHMSGFDASLDIKYGYQDDDKRWHVSFGGEDSVDKILAIVDILKNNKGVLYNSNSDADPSTVAGNHDVYRASFKNGNILFITSEFDQIKTVYRDMERPFGVIPYPKWDEDQDGYRTIARNIYSSFVIPKTCEKTEAVGAAMEALASMNYRTTSRTYFETALKVKYSHDDESSQMYDIIKDSLKFNFMFTFSQVTGAGSLLIGSAVNKQTNIASQAAKSDPADEKNLQKFYEDVLALD